MTNFGATVRVVRFEPIELADSVEARESAPPELAPEPQPATTVRA